MESSEEESNKSDLKFHRAAGVQSGMKTATPKKKLVATTHGGSETTLVVLEGNYGCVL